MFGVGEKTMRNATYIDARHRIKQKKRIKFIKEMALFIYCGSVMVFIAGALSYSIVHW